MSNIETQYKKAKAEVIAKLESLSFTSSSPDKIRGLNGWVFEQIVLRSIKRDLKKAKIDCAISEQESIGGRARVDLLVGNVAVEIKVSGYMDNVEQKYTRYRRLIERKGWVYFYVTLYEGYDPYVKMAERIYGPNRFFILSQDEAWNRFSEQLISTIR